ncbi:hypothetical protein E2562_019219 [Oryza meyeriana var. granulata]|uniref:Uncharacterized protein n=1 Tax=Oryza meyeriana var. granulata TaxID=110450 RepID=A0A6G1FA53_9ORYZ|nr:hypothetical protein E2562_019219 [Oryza meyeriana var. granulata]
MAPSTVSSDDTNPFAVGSVAISAATAQLINIKSHVPVILVPPPPSPPSSPAPPLPSLPLAATVGLAATPHRATTSPTPPPRALGLARPLCPLSSAAAVGLAVPTRRRLALRGRCPAPLE